MIKKEDIKVGSFLKIRKYDLEAITNQNFVEELNKHCPLNTCVVVKVSNMIDEMCEIRYSSWCKPAVVDAECLANVAISSSTQKTANKKTDSDRFNEITDNMFETFKAKNHDYGSSFSNLFKECGMTYAYGHMAEKLERVKSLMKDEAKVNGEGMKDSLLDLANYAILTVMEIDKNEKEQKE